MSYMSVLGQVCTYVCMYVKVRFALKQVMKAHRRSRGIALFIL